MKVMGKLYSAKSLNCSFYGNPRYELLIETNDGEMLRGKTLTDGAIGYACNNYQNREVVWEYHITRKGNIIFDKVYEQS